MTLTLQQSSYLLLVLSAYGLLCWSCWRSYRNRQRQLELPTAGAAALDSSSAAPLLVAYASQSGRGAELAQQTAHTLQNAGLVVQLLPLNKVSEHQLRQCQRALFIASTYGEGDAPDMGASFERRHLTGAEDLQQLEFAVLALGDRQYQHFCAFGHRLHNGLCSRGATALFDLVEMDGEDAEVLHHWQQQLQQLAPGADVHLEQSHYQTVALEERTCLNPEGQGAPVFHLQLQATDLNWQAGDIASILPRNSEVAVAEFVNALDAMGSAAFSDDAEVQEQHDALLTGLQLRQLPHADADLAKLAALPANELLPALPPLVPRDYSIASVPEDGHVALLVRQMRHPDGRLGVASGWLTEHIQQGAAIELRLRANPGFRPPPPATPLILIGNGTGLAGLRSHLRARELTGSGPNWLIFGERNAAHDTYFHEDLQHWQRTGHLARTDLAYSRDSGSLRYVQDVLQSAPDELRSWMAKGAAVYVCGSREGMAAAVDQALRQLLGDQAVEQLLSEGRYCRDVY